jgi:TatD DNase family protein
MPRPGESLDLIDSHVHLDDDAFTPDWEAMMARARAAGVRAFLSIATSLAGSRRVIALAEAQADVYASIGVHPHDATSATPETMTELAALAKHPKVVAIGETGLDYYRNFAPREAQESAFRAHLRLAREVGLPVIIHSRDAGDDVLDMLAAESPGAGRVIMHCFSGSAEMAQACVDRGYYLGLGGPITYRNAKRLLEVAAAVPPDRMLLETDAPYLPPEPHRGKRNESSYMPLIAAAVAKARGVAAGTVAEITTLNAIEAFGLRRIAARE